MFAVANRVQRAWRLRLRASETISIAALGAMLLSTSPAHAGPGEPQAEIFTGLDATNNAVSGYVGGGYAFGKGLYAPGWRVRAVGLGNEAYDAGRGGGFVRLNLRGVELTVSGGATGNYLEDEPSGYLSLGVYRAF
jgi:hypothetical protein